MLALPGSGTAAVRRAWSWGTPRDTDEPRVLIVDDEVMLRTLFGRVLEREGFAYRTASSAASALDALEQQAYALILLDRRLGQYDARPSRPR